MYRQTTIEQVLTSLEYLSMVVLATDVMKGRSGHKEFKITARVDKHIKALGSVITSSSVVAQAYLSMSKYLEVVSFYLYNNRLTATTIAIPRSQYSSSRF